MSGLVEIARRIEDKVESLLSRDTNPQKKEVEKLVDELSVTMSEFIIELVNAGLVKLEKVLNILQVVKKEVIKEIREGKYTYPYHIIPKEKRLKEICRASKILLTTVITVSEEDLNDFPLYEYIEEVLYNFLKTISELEDLSCMF